MSYLHRSYREKNQTISIDAKSISIDAKSISIDTKYTKLKNIFIFFLISLKFYASKMRTLTELNMRSPYDRLLAAASDGSITTCRNIMAMGIDVDSKVNYGHRTALNAACHNGHIEVAKLLLEYGADVDSTDDCLSRPLHSAVCARAGLQYRIDLCKLLLDHGANVNAMDTSGRTPLKIAATNVDFKVCELLLSRGACIYIRDSWGLSALHYACSNQMDAVDVCRLLLDYGADINQTCHLNGQTPLFYASMKGNKKLCELLLDRGADMTIKNRWGESCLEIATRKNEYEVVKILNCYMERDEIVSRRRDLLSLMITEDYE